MKLKIRWHAGSENPGMPDGWCARIDDGQGFGRQVCPHTTWDEALKFGLQELRFEQRMTDWRSASVRGSAA